MIADQHATTETGRDRGASAVLHRLVGVLKGDAEWMLSAVDRDLNEVASVLQADAEWVLQALDRHAPEWDAQLGPRNRRIFRMMVLFSVLGNRDRDMLLAFAARLAQGKPVAGETSAYRPAPRRTGYAGKSVEPVGGRLGAARVLLVDDDPDSLRITRAMLRKCGFEVTIAASGDEALALMDSEASFDVLVTDYAMPGLNGLGLIELAQEREPHLPSLVVTAYGNDIATGRLPAGVKVLAKPFTRAEFVERIRALTRARVGADAADPAANDFARD
jgi:CheY-like chemotaxis protein